MSDLVTAIMFIVFLLFVAIVPLIIVFGENLLKAKSFASRVAGWIIIVASIIAIASFVISIIATFEVQSGIALALGLVSAPIISWGGVVIAKILSKQNK
ncbi:hypothetical protein [Helicobacter sp. 23-1045]